MRSATFSGAVRARTSLFGMERIVNAVGGPENVAPLLFVGAGIVFLAIIFLALPEPDERGRYRYEYETLVVVSATILLAGLIQVLTAFLRALSLRGQRLAFQLFFGRGRIDGIVPDLAAPSLEPGWQPPDDKRARPVGTNVVPFGDLRAAISLAELFESFGLDFRISPDMHPVAPSELERGSVAIGLGFNSLTRQLCASSGVFEIVYEEHDGALKDDFIIDGIRHDAPNKRSDFALIARVPSMCQDGVKRPAFVCAGRCAPGTAAAGYFLKRNWRAIYDIYARERKLLNEEAVVLEIEYDPRAPMQSHITRHCFSHAAGDTTVDSTLGHAVLTS